MNKFDCPGRFPPRVTVKLAYMGISPNGMEIWIVDGLRVRNQINPEFAEGDIHDNEIWIDMTLTPKEREDVIRKLGATQ